jgi:hypothetical protein
MRLFWWRHTEAVGGEVVPHAPSDDIPVQLSEGKQVTDPAEAEQLGLATMKGTAA